MSRLEPSASSPALLNRQIQILDNRVVHPPIALIPLTSNFFFHISKDCDSFSIYFSARSTRLMTDHSAFTHAHGHTHGHTHTLSLSCTTLKKRRRVVERGDLKWVNMVRSNEFFFKIPIAIFRDK